MKLKDYFYSKLKYGILFNNRLKRIKSYQDMTDDQLLILENEKLINNINNAYSKSSFYKNLYNEHGVDIKQIKTIEDLTKLPIITKDLIKNHVENLYVGNKLIRHTTYTSGTSGTPLKVYYSLNCVLNEASYNEIFRNNAGHFFGQKIISLRGALDGTTKEYFDKSNNILYLSSYHIKPENALWYYNTINQFNPNAILAYPSALEALSNILSEKNLSVKIPLSFTSSETLYPHQQAKIEKLLNTKIYDRYGNAERTISLVQQKHKGAYSFPKLYSINEFSLHKDIITTNLINNEFPLIRYQVNDVIDFPDKNNEVQNIQGRIDDFIITPDGLKVGSAAMSLAFKKAPNVLFAQIIQNKPDLLTINIVVNSLFSEENKLFLKQQIKQRLGSVISFNINEVPENKIIKTKKNKYKLIISELK